ncbi:MAG: hypothetical protein NTW87_08220 [Planctomycetota bacterium]|nr:hypothetical protein [Planctomycetota bacterium]
MRTRCLILYLLALSAGLTAAIAGEDRGQAAALKLRFVQEWRSGTRDASGEFMAGTETMRLLGYKGKLYASLGDWMDVPYGKAKGDNPWTGAQVLVKESAEGPWRIAVCFGESYLRTEALAALAFTTDAKGVTLANPVTMLAAGPSDVNLEAGAHATVWTRDDATGKWTKTEVAREPRQAGVRSFGSHVDKVTHVHHVFAGVSRGEIYRGVYDPAAAGKLRWEHEPELSGTGRVMCFTECNGDLYAAAGLKEGGDTGGLYRRVDGSQPKWGLVYRWPYTPVVKGDEANIMRGLTAVSDAHGSAGISPATAHQVLLGTRAHPGVVERIDPAKDHAVSVELDIKARFAKEWGLAELRGPALSAYNRMVPFGVPGSGELVHFIGVWVNHPDHRTPPHNGAYYLVRRQDGHYDCGTVYDREHPMAAGRGLVATRTIEVSPFPEDRGRVLYFGGYDCASQESHNTAWIYKGLLEGSARGQGER